MQPSTSPTSTTAPLPPDSVVIHRAELSALYDAQSALEKEKTALRQQIAALTADRTREAQEWALERQAMEGGMRECEMQMQMIQSELERVAQEKDSLTRRQAPPSPSADPAAVEMLKIRIRELEKQVESTKDLRALCQSLSAELGKMQDVARAERATARERDFYKQTQRNTFLLEEQLVSLQTKLEGLAKRDQETADVQIELQRLRTDKAHWDVMLTMLRVSSPSDAVQSIAEWQQTHARVSEEFRIARDRLAAADAELAELRTNAASLGSQLASVQAQCEQLQGDAAKLKARNMTLMKERQGMLEVLDSYTKEEPSGVNAALQRRLLEAEQRLLESDRGAGQSADDATAGTARLVSELDKCRAALSATQLEKTHAEAREADLRAGLGAAQGEVAGLRKEREALEKAVIDLEARVTRGEYNPSTTKVVHMTLNPQQASIEAEFEKCRKENHALRLQLNAAKGENQTNEIERMFLENQKLSADLQDAQRRVRQLETAVKEADIKVSRLRSVYTVKVQEFMDVCFQLTGFRVALHADKVYHLHPMYSESEEDFFEFVATKEGYRLLDTPYAKMYSEEARTYLAQCHSIPAFLAEITLKQFGSRTFNPPQGPSSSPFSSFTPMRPPGGGGAGGVSAVSTPQG